MSPGWATARRTGWRARSRAGSVRRRYARPGLLRAGGLRRPLGHRVTALQRVVCLVGAHQLALLESEHHSRLDVNALADGALVRAGLRDDAVAADGDMHR